MNPIYPKPLTKHANSDLLRFIGWFFGLNGVLFCLLGYRYLHITFQSTTLFHNYYSDLSTASGKALILSFIFVNYFCYMMLLSFILASVSAALAWLIPKRRLIFFWVIGLASLGVIGLIVDIEVYSLYRFHLNAIMLEFIFSQDFQSIFELTHAEFCVIALIILLVLSFEVCLAWVVWNRMIVPRRFMVGKTCFILWLGLLVICYFTMMLMLSVHNNNLLIQQTSNLPLYNTLLSSIIPQKNARECLNRNSEGEYMQVAFGQHKMNYPLHPMQCQPKHPYNIILIIVDSLRADVLNNMPHTQQFAADNWQFMHHLSGGNCTQAGLFSLFYSLPSTYWTAALSQHVSPIWLDLLQQYGYDMRIIASAELRRPPLHQTIFQKLQNLPINGSDKPTEAARERDVTSQAIAYLHQQPKQPFFLNVLYNAPHAFCHTESFPVIYRPSQKFCSRISVNNHTDRIPYFHNYLNTVDYIDKEISTLIKKISSSGYLDQSIVIISADHGQEFNETHQNYWGHASNYSSYQIHIPLIIHWPNQPPQKITHTTTSYDVVPTLLKRLFACQNATADYSIGHDLLTPGGRELLLAGSYANSAIIEPDRLTTLHNSGEVEVTDLNLNPIPQAKPSTTSMNRALEWMKRYYNLKN